MLEVVVIAQADPMMEVIIRPELLWRPAAIQTVRLTHLVEAVTMAEGRLSPPYRVISLGCEGYWFVCGVTRWFVPVGEITEIEAVAAFDQTCRER